MKALLKKINEATTRLYIRGRLLGQDCGKLLAGEDGASGTVEQIIFIIVVIVLIAVLVLPSIWKTIEGSLDGADSKISDIWNYKG